MRIGIVNDVPLAVEALRRAVVSRPEHHVVWVAENGVEAVTLCARDRPDLVLMDVVMPHMDGVEATRRIMARTPCPILIVTVSVGGHAERVFEAMGHGALDAIDTPALGTGNAREPEECVYRPSIDVLFHSVSRHWPGPAVGVLLTGMGRDGALGLKALRDKGNHTIAQDQTSSAVYGMPKAAAALGAAVDIVPMDRIAERLVEALARTE